MLLPKAHATSLLRRDETGRTLFFPDGNASGSYVVPDTETEQRIFRQLGRIRFAELAAWAFLPVAVLTALALTDGQIPNWLFILSILAAVAAIQVVPETARRNLGQGLARASEDQLRPSLLARLPYWAIILAIALAVGLAFYLGRAGPLKTLARIDEIGPAILASKGFAKVAVIVAGAAAVVWGAAGVIKRWFRRS